MQKPDISRLPTSQMMKFLQVFELPELGGKDAMAATLEGVSDEQWADAEVEFQVDQL